MIGAADYVVQRLLLDQFKTRGIGVSPQVHGSWPRAAIPLMSNTGPQLPPCPEHADILEEIVTLSYLKTYACHELIGIQTGSLAGVSNGDSGSQAK